MEVTSSRKDIPSIDVCICGHLEGAHLVQDRDPETGEVLETHTKAPCSPSGWSCGCVDLQPILKATGGVFFGRVSKPLPGGHALLSGVNACYRAGGDVLFNAGQPSCGLCESMDYATPVRFIANKETTPWTMTDRMVCLKCIEKYGIEDGEVIRQRETGIFI